MYCGLFGVPFAFMELLFEDHYEFSIGQIGTAVLNVLQGKLWDHMWYLYMIAGLYLVLPLLKIFVSNANRKAMEYILLILFIFTSVIPTVQNMFQIKIGFYLPVNSVFMFYLLLGYYIHNYNIRVRKRTLAGMALFYIVYIIILQLKTGAIVGLYSNISPLVVMITVTIFCYIRQNKKVTKFHAIVSPYCFGIYLIHAFFLNIFYKAIKFVPRKYPLTMVVIIITAATSILSFGFSYYSCKIKVIKKYVL